MPKCPCSTYRRANLVPRRKNNINGNMRIILILDEYRRYLRGHDFAFSSVTNLSSTSEI